MNKRLTLILSALAVIGLGALIGCGSVGETNTYGGRTAGVGGQITTATSQPTTASGAMLSNKRPLNPAGIGQ